VWRVSLLVQGRSTLPCDREKRGKTCSRGGLCGEKRQKEPKERDNHTKGKITFVGPSGFFAQRERGGEQSTRNRRGTGHRRPKEKGEGELQGRKETRKSQKGRSGWEPSEGRAGTRGGETGAVL